MSEKKSFNASYSTEVNLWLASLSEHVPLKASSDHQHDAAIQELLKHSPGIVGSNREALLWLRVGRIDQAHMIVQDATAGIDAYIHGVVHRLEGDYWNSKYWFRQVRDPSLVQKVISEVESKSKQAGLATGLAKQFDPSQFVDTCERVLGKPKESDLLDQLRQLGQFEWEALGSLKLEA